LSLITESASTKRGGRSTKTISNPSSRSRCRYAWSPSVGAMMMPSTPRAARLSTSSRSRAESSSELPAKTSTLRARATSSTLRWSVEKNGLATSSSSRPTVRDRRSARRSVLAVRSRR
jgi:hypothetical protein